MRPLLLPDPTSASFSDWANELTDAVAPNVAVPGEDSWKNFGLEVIRSAPSENLVSPELFSSWRAWALTFVS
jgi:hypothetical protein